MKASLKWISKYVDISGLTPEEIAHRLTFAGAEVEGIERMASGTNLIIGEIISCVAHPDSDHLHILNVDEGEEGVHQIVCGAPNARKGLKVIVARTGAKLPEVEIKPSVIRGVESDGMCCSLLELGVDKKFLSEKQCSGIEELKEDAVVGNKDVLGYLGLDDVVLDISVLPNRPDLYAIKNIVKEIACLFDLPLKEEKEADIAKLTTDIKVGSLTKKCPLFSAREIKGVSPCLAPSYMKEALQAEGVRSIDAIVDIGNYVMLETGQPLNMYDADKLPKGELIVRDDYEGDFVAMDGNTYKLQKGDLVVTSNGLPMCLAGIMTAEVCKVDENTKNIIVEAALFDGAAIRHTSNRLGLSSDSSLRFCKGINPHQVESVQIRTSNLVSMIVGGEVSKTVLFDEVNHDLKKIKTSLGYINGRLGTSFSLEMILDCLRKDHFEVKNEGEELLIDVPSYRIDIDGEADISEEVIRILGFDKIESTLPVAKLTCNGLSENQQKERWIRHHLLQNGISQALTYTLITREEAKRFAYLNLDEPYVLSNPLTVDKEALRTNILYSLLKAASYNAARQEKDVALFEISDVDSPKVKGKHLSIVLSGNKSSFSKMDEQPYDFYDIKGVLEGLMEILGLNKNRYQISPLNSPKEEFHPGMSAKITSGKILLGVMGVIHPLALKELGLKNAVGLELDLAALFEMKVGAIKANIPSRFPSVSRDLAFLIGEEIPFEDIERKLRSADPLIKEVRLFDVYRDEKLPAGKKSIAVSLTLLNEERTLKDEEVALALKKAMDTLATSFGAEIRG